MRLKTITSILLLAFVLLGCTREDLTGCFEQSGIQIQFRYEQQEQTASTQLPVERIDLYLFDAQRRYVCSVVDSEGPFNVSRIYNIPLSPGKYTAVAWGNQHQLRVTPDLFVVGQTTLDEARLLLSGTTPSVRSDELLFIDGPQKNLYHSIVQEISVADGPKSKVDMLLSRNTKQINVSVRFTRPDGTPCDHPSHATTPTIRSNDGLHNFENSLIPCDDFFYRPASRTDITGGYDALFNKMRLLLNEQSEIILNKSDAGGVFYHESLMKWLKGTGYDTQEKIDRTHTYNIELLFRCSEDHNSTYTTVTIKVNGWVYVNNEDEV